MSEGVKRIMLERGRQVSEEGWTAEDDDRYVGGDLVLAAVCYAAPIQIYKKVENFRQYQFVDPYPWTQVSDKRLKHNRIRQLEIAGALIAAEIDRLVRAGEGGI